MIKHTDVEKQVTSSQWYTISYTNNNNNKNNKNNNSNNNNNNNVMWTMPVITTESEAPADTRWQHR